MNSKNITVDTTTAEAGQPKSLDRRRLLRGLGGAAVAIPFGGFLAACAADGETADLPSESTDSSAATVTQLDGSVRTVRATAVSWLWAPFLVAEAKDYFASEGLTQNGEAIGTGEVAGLVVSGEAQAIIGSPLGPMKSTLQGESLTTFAALVTTYASNVVITGDAFEAAGLTEDSTNAERGAALAGLRMATTGPGAGPDLLLRYIASQLGGLNPETDMTLTPVQGGGSAMLAAVENAQIDGFCLSSPTSDQGVAQFGMKYLFNMALNPIPELEGYLYIVASARSDYLESNPEHIAAYCRALKKALNFIANEPDEFKAIMLGLFGDVDPEVFETGFNANYPIYGTTIVPTQAQFDSNVSFLKTSFEVQDQDATAAAAMTFDDAFNASFAQAAESAVGSAY